MDDGADELLAESGGDELWLISYSDLLTLLTAFFAVMVAAAPSHSARLEQVASQLAGGAPTPLTEAKRDVEALAAHAGLADRVTVRIDDEGLGVELADVLLFDSGSAEVKPSGRALVEEVGRALGPLAGRSIVVEGHTDDVPIHTALFRSNWELSSQRAINVLSLLESAGVPRERLSVRGFADTRMPRDGSLEERRSRSRKVLIRVE